MMKKILIIIFLAVLFMGCCQQPSGGGGGGGGGGSAVKDTNTVKPVEDNKVVLEEGDIPYEVAKEEDTYDKPGVYNYADDKFSSQVFVAEDETGKKIGILDIYKDNFDIANVKKLINNSEAEEITIYVNDSENKVVSQIKITKKELESIKTNSDLLKKEQALEDPSVWMKELY